MDRIIIAPGIQVEFNIRKSMQHINILIKEKN